MVDGGSRSLGSTQGEDFFELVGRELSDDEYEATQHRRQEGSPAQGGAGGGDDGSSAGGAAAGQNE